MAKKQNADKMRPTRWKEEDLAAADARAAALGLSFSAYLRMLVKKDLASTSRPSKPKHDANP